MSVLWKKLLALVLAHRELAGIAGFGVLLVAFALIKTCAPAPLPKREQFTGDSLQATRPAFVVQHDTVERIVTKVLTKIVTDSAPLSQLAAKADTLKQISDSLATVAGVRGDTANALADARLHELTIAHARIDTLSNDLTEARGALRASLTQLHADSSRYTALEDFDKRLQHDLGRQPSRTRWFLAGAGIAAAASSPKLRKWASDEVKRLVP